MWREGCAAIQPASKLTTALRTPACGACARGGAPRPSLLRLKLTNWSWRSRACHGSAARRRQASEGAGSSGDGPTATPWRCKEHAGCCACAGTRCAWRWPACRELWPGCLGRALSALRRHLQGLRVSPPPRVRPLGNARRACSVEGGAGRGLASPAWGLAGAWLAGRRASAAARRTERGVQQARLAGATQGAPSCPPARLPPAPAPVPRSERALPPPAGRGAGQWLARSGSASAPQAADPLGVRACAAAPAAPTRVSRALPAPCLLSPFALCSRALAAQRGVCRHARQARRGRGSREDDRCPHHRVRRQLHQRLRRQARWHCASGHWRQRGPRRRAGCGRRRVRLQRGRPRRADRLGCR